MNVTPQVLLDLQAQFQMDFQVAFGKRDENRWKNRAYRANTTAYKTVHSWLAAQPDMRQWVGARVINNLVARAFTLTNADWEYTFAVDVNDIFYDNLGVYADRGVVAGDVAGRWYEKVVTDAMVAGNSTICWDGQYFYDTDHPVNFDDATAGTYSNSLSALPLTSDNLWTVCAQMLSLVDENGLPLEVTPSVIEVPPVLGKAAFQAVAAPIGTAIIKNVAGSENVAATAIPNMLPEALNSIQGTLQVVINPRLTNANVYYVHSTNRLKPFVMQVAQDPTALYMMESATQGDRERAHNKRYVFGTDAKGVAAGTLPFLSFRVSQT